MSNAVWCLDLEAHSVEKSWSNLHEAQALTIAELVGRLDNILLDTCDRYRFNNHQWNIDAQVFVPALLGNDFTNYAVHGVSTLLWSLDWPTWSSKLGRLG